MNPAQDLMNATPLTGEQVQRLETAVLDFDLGWHPGRWVEFVRGLPTADPLWRRRVVVEATKVDLERSYRAGRRPGLAEYAAVCPELADDPALAAELQAAVAELERRSGTLHIAGSAVDTSTADAAPPSPAAPESLGMLRDYRLLAELGRGGMGTVYRALHTRLEKVVALKVLPSERLARREERERFEREMRAVGQMNHPHLVAAHDAGEADGKHFLVMELVAGADVGKFPAPLAVPEACEIVRQAALGLHYAHERGLVHRDVKPSNLMLARREAGDGARETVVKVLDFGLALLGRDAPTGRDLTNAGAVMGTVDFLAPEQALDSHTVDRRADVYSLGATLFKLLAGTAPFEDGAPRSLTQRLLAMQNTSAPPLATRRPDLPAELTRLVDRMLAKTPEERPAMASEVAASLVPWCAGADLTRLLANHEPSGDIGDRALAEPLPPAAQPAGREGRGTRLLLALAVSAAVLLGVVFYFSTGTGVVSVTINEPNARVTYDEGSQRIVVAVSGRTVTIRPSPGRHTLLVEKDGHVQETREFQVRRRRKLQLAVVLKPLEPPSNLRLRLGKTLSPGVPTEAAYSPRGELLAVANHERQVVMIDTTTWRTVWTGERHGHYVVGLAFSPQGTTLASCGYDGKIHLWNVANGHWLGERVGHVGAIRSVAFHPDGKVLASAGGGDPGGNQRGKGSMGDSHVRLWDVAENKERLSLQGHDGDVFGVAFSADGERLVSCGADGTIRCWDWRRGRPLHTPANGHRGPVAQVTFSADGRQLASAGLDRTAIVWDVRDGGIERRRQFALEESTGGVGAVAFSPNGQQLATGSDNGLVCLWDIASGKRLAEMAGPQIYVLSLSFSPDGKRLAAVSWGVQVYDLETAESAVSPQ